MIKRDGRHEEFNRQKLERGLSRACEKRPISADDIHDLVDQLISGFEGESEVTSERIGQAVMERLHRVMRWPIFALPRSTAALQM